MHVQLLLIIILSIFICSPSLAQESDWQSLFKQVDSLVAAKNSDSALILSAYNLSLAENNRHINDSMMAVVLFHHGKTHFRTASYDKADTILQASLTLRQKIFSDPHLDIAESQYYLALLYNVRGWREKTDVHFKEVLQAQKVILGEKDLKYLHTLRMFARHIKNWGQFERGKSILLGLMDILNQIEPSPDSVKIEVYWNLATVTSHMSDYSGSLQNYQNALDIQTKLHGDTSFKAIRLRYNIASVTNSLEKYDQSREKYESLLADIQMLLINIRQVVF